MTKFRILIAIDLGFSFLRALTFTVLLMFARTMLAGIPSSAMKHNTQMEITVPSEKDSERFLNESYGTLIIFTLLCFIFDVYIYFCLHSLVENTKETNESLVMYQSSPYNPHLNKQLMQSSKLQYRQEMKPLAPSSNAWTTVTWKLSTFLNFFLHCFNKILILFKWEVCISLSAFSESLSPFYVKIKFSMYWISQIADSSFLPYVWLTFKTMPSFIFCNFR